MLVAFELCIHPCISLYFLFTFFGHAVAKGVLSFQEFDMQFGCLAFLWAQSRPQLVTAQAVSMFLNLQLRLSKWEQMVCMPIGTARPGVGPSSGFLRSSSSEPLQTGPLVRFQTLFLLVSCSLKLTNPAVKASWTFGLPCPGPQGKPSLLSRGRDCEGQYSSLMLLLLLLACGGCLHRGVCASSHCARDEPHHWRHTMDRILHGCWPSETHVMCKCSH